MRTACQSASAVGPCLEADEVQGGHSKATEGDLVRLLKTGSQVAFREFVERHQSRVFKVTCGILGSRQAADEVAQRVFVKVHCSIQRFDGRYSLVAWLHRIAVNESYSSLRNKRPELSREDGSARELVNRLLERIP